MDDIKVSVCMVTYNHERFIRQAIESVLAQRVKFALEVVVGEDCSTDNTRAILQEFADKHPEKFVLRLAKRNQGPKANFLNTITACRGQYVALLEGDDYWTCPDKLQMQVDVLEARPEWAMCFHPTACVYEAGMAGQSIYPLDWQRPEATVDDLFVANFIPTNSVVFRNRLFGPFPPWFRHSNLGDWPLHILNATHGKIGFLPAVMSAYRIHRNGVWIGATPVERETAIFQMFTAIDHHFGGKYTEQCDRYRLTALRNLMSDLDAARQRHSELAEEMERKSKVHAELQEHCNQLSNELVSLVRRFQVISEEHRKYQRFYESWRRSMLFRIMRETRRPFVQLGQYVRRRLSGTDEKTPPADSPMSKAA
jgi:glycosyltransferase involved in cell wall biosynthesis